MASLLTGPPNQQENGLLTNTIHESNATRVSIQSQHHITANSTLMLNGQNKPQPPMQQAPPAYASHRNNSFSLYKCPNQTNGGGSICGSIKSSSTVNSSNYLGPYSEFSHLIPLLFSTHLRDYYPEYNRYFYTIQHRQRAMRIQRVCVQATVVAVAVE